MESQKCIWMDAESVEYQLCPLKQNCDLCDFHREMMRGCRRPGIKAESTTIDIKNPEVSVIQFTPGLQFTHRHFWIKRTGKGKIRLGIDAFLWQFFSSVQKIITPKINSTLLQQQCFSWLQLENDIIYLRTPVSGQILQSNPVFSSNQIQDTYLYMSPEEELWFVELEVDESSLGLEYLRRDEYMKMAVEDLESFGNLLDKADDPTPHTFLRRSQLNKSAFSKYLLSISDSLAYVS